MTRKEASAEENKESQRRDHAVIRHACSSQTFLFPVKHAPSPSTARRAPGPSPRRGTPPEGSRGGCSCRHQCCHRVKSEWAAGKGKGRQRREDEDRAQLPANGSANSLICPSDIEAKSAAGLLYEPAQLLNCQHGITTHHLCRRPGKAMKGSSAERSS